MYPEYFSSFLELLTGSDISALMTQLYVIVNAPFSTPDILWTIFPLITTVIVIELYFGSHKDEILGWNSATTNGLVLLWVGVNTVKSLIDSGGFDTALFKSQVALGIVALGLLLVMISFFHILPREIAFFVSSSLVVHYLAFLAVIFVYTDIVFTDLTLFAALLIFIALVVLFKLIKHLEPEIY
ncbi:MAG: hypothetical protein U9P44_00360 [archaeon]|nr:hypothetical protein [archaeon]